MAVAAPAFLLPRIFRGMLRAHMALAQHDSRKCNSGAMVDMLSLASCGQEGDSHLDQTVANATDMLPSAFQWKRSFRISCTSGLLRSSKPNSWLVMVGSRGSPTVPK